MRNQILLALAAASMLGLVAVRAVPVVYKLPDETAAFKPGPNLDVVQNNCTACHSADYIATQPRGPKYKKSCKIIHVLPHITFNGDARTSRFMPSGCREVSATPQ